MKQLNFLSKSSSRSCGHRVTTLALTVGSQEEFYVSGGNSRGAFTPADVCQTSSVRLNRFTAHRRGTMLRLLSVLVLILTFGVGQMWGDPTVLFHETFGNNGNSNTVIASASCYTASTSYFTTGHQTSAVSNYSGDSKVGKASANPSDNTGASGNSAVWFTGSKNTTQTITLFKVENINISGYTTLKLKFNVKRNDGSTTTNKITVKYKIDSGSEQTLSSYSAPSGTGWTWSDELSLSGTGSSLTITFSHYSTGGYTTRLDDIILTGVSSTPSCSAPTSPNITGTTSYTTGQTISLTASATGTTSGTTTYQWYKGDPDNGGTSQGAASTSGATFTKANCVVGDAGTYYCVISNGTGCTAKTSKTITVSAPSYTVNWTINPAASGTLSATSGTSISVTPNSEYTYGSPAYTVTSGSATVTQNTNTFTATPSADCTIRINMVEKPKYEITYNAGTGSCATTSWTQTTADESTTLPTASTNCAGWTFAGWCTNAAGSSETNTTSPGDILTGSYTPTADVTLYAIYTHSESGESSSYNKVTSAPTDWTGDYLIVYETGALCFDANLATGSVDAVDNTQSVTISNNSIASTSTIDNYRWTVESVNGGYNIKSAKNGYYIGNTSQSNNSASNGLTRSASSSTDDGYVLTLAWDGTNNLPTIKASKNGNTFLVYNNTNNQTRFRFYKSSTCNAGIGTGEYKALSLFKKTSSSTKYYMTSLVCCSPLGQINGSFLRYHFSDHFGPFGTNQQISVYFS